MLDSIVASPVVLTLICAAFAILVVMAGYMSPYMNGLAIPAPMPAKFPVKSFSRHALIVFALIVNAASLGLAHRLPLGTDLIVAGFLMLLFLPADQEADERASQT